MSAQFGFNETDGHDLALFALEGDSARLADWLADHILTHRDMHALLEYIGRVISKTWPMALTKGINRGESDFWAMEAGPNSTPAAIASTQMITASLNEDWDSLTALIRAALSKSEEFHASVVAHMLKALGDGLRALTHANTP